MISTLSFIIDWNLEVSVSKWVWWFDYAAVFDLVAAILLFAVSKWKLKGKTAKKTTHASEVMAVVAAAIWIIDIKLNHRLSALQQNASDAQIATLTNSLAQAEEGRKQAQSSASIAVAASQNATSEAQKLAAANAKVAELEAKSAPRRISPEKRSAMMRFFVPNMGSGNKIRMAYSSDTEQFKFAKDLAEVLKAIGFSVEESVVVNPKARVAAFAALQSSLKEENIESTWYGDDGMDTNALWVIVGKKPY